MASAIIVMGILNILTPIILAFKAGAGPHDKDDSIMVDWLMSLSLEQRMLLQNFILCGVSMLGMGICMLAL